MFHRVVYLTWWVIFEVHYSIVKHVRHFLLQSAKIFKFCDVEHDRIAGYTATFTRIVTPKPSTCMQNTVIIGARWPSGWKVWIWSGKSRADQIHTFQPDGQRALMITIFCTQVLGLGVTILVNVAVYPAILSCSTSQNVKNLRQSEKKMTLQRKY